MEVEWVDSALPEKTLSGYKTTWRRVRVVGKEVKSCTVELSNGGRLEIDKLAAMRIPRQALR